MTVDPNEIPSPAPSAEFIEQVTRVQWQLHAFVWSLARNADDADDVLHEINLVLWRRSA
ncbi:MAG: hypothetical protein KDN22_11020 [Verrucomicrobiae bacterium]|nr:hypothetical protein [Verrucomicrobiae bacterium]